MWRVKIGSYAFFQMNKRKNDFKFSCIMASENFYLLIVF